jgi:hypothetical protein
MTLLTNGRSALATGDPPQEAHNQEDIAEEHSFDELAKRLVDASLSRRRALKLIVSALLGGSLLTLIPGVAETQVQSIGGNGKGGGRNHERSHRHHQHHRHRQHHSRRGGTGSMACPPQRICGNECCPEGQQCMNGSCCPPERVCTPSNTCCPPGEICASGGGVCCPPTSVCTVGGVPNACCTGIRTCVGGLCT